MYGDLCEWPLIWCGDISDLDVAVTGYAKEAATEILWHATNERFGNCVIPLRPCRRECDEGWSDSVVWYEGVLSSRVWDYPWPTLINGVWINLACGLCTGDCSCGSVSKVVLADRINSIESIVIDGETLPVTGYVVYNGNEVIRTDGGEWPTCQDWTKTSGPGTWFINASFGEEVPRLGQMALGALTAEIARACVGEPCQLVASIQRVVRQGVTFERASVKDALDHRLTGVLLADRFIGTYNPKGISGRAQVWSPDRLVNDRVQR